MKLCDLIIDMPVISESVSVLLETNNSELTEEQLMEKHDIVRKMLTTVFGINNKYIQEIGNKYEITLSHLCDQGEIATQYLKNKMDKCLLDMRDKLISFKPLSTYDVVLYDDIIRLVPIMSTVR